MREIVIVTMAKKRRSEWTDLAEGYLARLDRWSRVRQKWINPSTLAGPGRTKVEEESWKRAVDKPSWVVALSEEGKTVSSVEFSRKIQRLRQTYAHPVCFLIGSDAGLPPVIRQSANEVLSFSRMTFGHELARLVLCEQLYRAFAIEHGIKYHRVPN